MRHLEREMENVKRRVLALSALVEENLKRSLLAVERRDTDLAAAVIESDFDIDLMEVDVEEDCLKILALHQPVASDLRFLVAAIKINTTLERIGDLAVNVAERALSLAESERPVGGFDLTPMADKAQAMVARSLDAFVKPDPQQARVVLFSDNEVDDMEEEIAAAIRATLPQHPEWTDWLVNLLSVARFIERLADHATSIAEDVIYMVEGEIPRHHLKRVAAEEMGLSSFEG